MRDMGVSDDLIIPTLFDKIYRVKNKSIFMSDKNEKYLTLSDLSQFTEEVLLPAISAMIDEKLETKLEEKFEEKLGPIRVRLSDIEDDIKRLEQKIDRIAKAGSEDIFAVNGDVQDLWNRVRRLEERIKVLESARS
jgi:archaellum component FlaC